MVQFQFIKKQKTNRKQTNRKSQAGNKKSVLKTSVNKTQQISTPWKVFVKSWCDRIPVSRSRVGERVNPHGSVYICVCVCVNPLSPSSTPGRNSAWKGGRRREPEEEEEGGGSKLSYGAAMDEFNRSQWEGKEPIRMLHFLVVRHQFCHLNCPRRDGEKEGEWAEKQYVVSFIPSHFFLPLCFPPVFLCHSTCSSWTLFH